MKIAVCIKRVPDSETRVKIAADGKSLDEAGVKFILNPYDEFAVEEALRQKEKAGAGEVVVIALGDRKSTRLNSSHRCISYAVFCLKKKNKNITTKSKIHQ